MGHTCKARLKYTYVVIDGLSVVYSIRSMGSKSETLYRSVLCVWIKYVTSSTVFKRHVMTAILFVRFTLMTAKNTIMAQWESVR
jgi:hypothetical protein